MAIKVIYLAKGHHRPRVGNTVVIDCRRGYRKESLSESPCGITMRVSLEDLDDTIAGLEQKGATKVYVRK